LRTADAIAEGKHVCMVSKEAESVAGPMLAKLARDAGVVCTLVDGDQPSLLVGLLDWCKLLGLEVVCAGKSGEGDYTVDPKAETIRSGGTAEDVVHCPGLGNLW
jgi:predicted homoserine dehydrogenase-like protein